MFQLPVNKTYSQLNPDELNQVEEFKKDYWEKSRDRESYTIDDLSKYLWISNGSGLTISFGLFQAKGALSSLQFYGSCSFVLGIFILLLMKIISELCASRDRSRFQIIYGKFIRDESSSDDLIKIRDKTTRVLGLIIGYLRYSSCVTFVIGVLLFLISYS